MIVCWFLCFPPNFPELNLELFCSDVQNNFRFSSSKFRGKHRSQQTITCQVLAELNKLWSCLIFIKLYRCAYTYQALCTRFVILFCQNIKTKCKLSLLLKFLIPSSSENLYFLNRFLTASSIYKIQVSNFYLLFISFVLKTWQSIQWVPALRAFWDLEKTVLHEIRVSGTVVNPLLARKSPTCSYINQKPW